MQMLISDYPLSALKSSLPTANSTPTCLWSSSRNPIAKSQSSTVIHSNYYSKTLFQSYYDF